MFLKNDIPNIIINLVTVPVLNDPVDNLGAVFDPNIDMSFDTKLSSLQIITL